MEREDVVELFSKLRSAGLFPPSGNNAKQANAMIDNFLANYKGVTAQELEQLTTKLLRMPHWPRYFDIDDILTEIRKLDKVRITVQQKSRKSDLGRMALGRDLLPNESWTMALAQKCAKRHFKDASPEWVEMNKLELSTQCRFDFICDTCMGKNMQECSTGGHKPFLKVDKDSGLVVPYVDCNKCQKVLIPIASKGEQQQTRRGGGFSSAGQIMAEI